MARIFNVPDQNLVRLDAEVVRFAKNHQPPAITRQEPVSQLRRDDLLAFDHEAAVVPCEAPEANGFTKVLVAAENLDWGASGGFHAVPIHRYCCVIAALMRQFGYLSRAQAATKVESTADVAWELCTRPAGKIAGPILRRGLKVNPDDVGAATTALDWAVMIDAENQETGLHHDLAHCCRQLCATAATVVLVGSVISRHRHHLDKIRQLDHREPGWVGRKRQRLTLRNVIFRSHKECPGRGGYVELADINGDHLVWRPQHLPSWLDHVVEAHIEAKIIDHATFANHPETLIDEVQLLHVVAEYQPCRTSGGEPSEEED